MKRVLLIVDVLALIVTVAIAILTTPPVSKAAQTPALKPIAVKPGTVTASVKATGHLEANRTVSLNFDTSGRVSDVFVVQGQSVVTGTPLARLDTTDLQLAVAQAQSALDKANATLAKTKAAPLTDDVNNARTAVTSAQAAYNVLVAGPNKDQVTSAAADLRTAEVSLQTAQGNYDKVSYKGSVGASSEAADLQTATIAYQKALANYNIAEQPPTDDKIKAAKAAIVDAQTKLDDLVHGALPEDVALNQADIESAQVALDTAKANLAKATLLAPFAGTVTSVNIDVGAQSAGTTAAIAFADLSVLHVDVPVDEIDMPGVKLGQPATITLDALPNTPLAGHVTAIDPSATSSTDTATTYDVTVTLDKQTANVLSGMTSKAEIETQRLVGVPVIPAALVQTDKTGATFVEKLGPDGQPVHTPVTLGLRSGQDIQVVSGLNIGDQVVDATTQVQQASTTGGAQQPRGLFPFGGGRPPAGGGGH